MGEVERFRLFFAFSYLVLCVFLLIHGNISGWRHIVLCVLIATITPNKKATKLRGRIAIVIVRDLHRRPYGRDMTCDFFICRYAILLLFISDFNTNIWLFTYFARPWALIKFPGLREISYKKNKTLQIQRNEEATGVDWRVAVNWSHWKGSHCSMI